VDTNLATSHLIEALAPDLPPMVEALGDRALGSVTFSSVFSNGAEPSRRSLVCGHLLRGRDA